MRTDRPRAPAGLGASGRGLWRAVQSEFELDEPESTILREACRTADSLDALQAQLDNDGVMSESSQGARVHPALVELRQQRVTLARLFAALAMPSDGLDATERHRQRRAPRGVYGITGAVS